MIKTNTPVSINRQPILRKIRWKLFEAFKIDVIVRLLKEDSSYLVESGWIKSVQMAKAIDRKGNPIPWLTYPFVQFIEPRLKASLTMYEYGSGNSTLWFAKYVGLIRSIEHDLEWYQRIYQNMPTNVTLVHKSVDKQLSYSELTYMNSQDVEAYTEDIRSADHKFDIILIDGIYRNRAIANAVECVTDQGVIILDNVDYIEAKEGINYLLNLGYRSVEFWGMCPIVHHDSCTAIFYKSENCLNL